MYVPYPWHVSSNHVSSTQRVYVTLRGLLTGGRRTRSWNKIRTYNWQTNYIEQISSWEAKSSSARQEIGSWYGTRRFITALTSAFHLSLPCVRAIQSMHPQPTYWRNILSLSSYPCLGLWSGFFPLDLPVGTSTVPHPCYMPRPLHSSWIYYPNSVWWGWIISQCVWNWISTWWSVSL